jgi:hypothetical protein
VPPNAVEPGTRLVDRYRLDKHLGEAAGTSSWRAHDELLDRPVGVCLLAADASQADRVLRAARRAAAVTDPRFLRVLDASEVDGPVGTVVYVVNEWVRATNLTDPLADGPLPAAAARSLTQEIAEALAAAHEEGLSHLCLQPEHVLRTSHGQVKIVGLAVEAAVRGVVADGAADAARRDAEGAASVAYAALTARWPGPDATGLAAAPHDGAALCSPRQVRAGIPHDLDQVVGRTLGVPGSGGAPVVTPAALAAALGDAQVTSRIPTLGPAEPAGTDSFPPGRLAPYEASDDQGRRRPGRPAVLAWGVVVLVLCVGLGLAGGQVLTSLGGGDGGPGAAGEETRAPSGSAAPTGDPVEVRAVTSFDPEGDDGEENEDRVGLVVDGDRSTAWTTKTYFDQFGDTGLKHGVGLVLDLGSVQEVGTVTVRTVGGGTDLELRTADQQGASVDDYDLVAKKADVDGNAVLVPRDALRTRYLLVWLTSLPAIGSDFRGSIAEISVRG